MKSDFKKEGRREISKRINDGLRDKPGYLSNFFPKVSKDKISADLIDRNALIIFLPVDSHPDCLSGHARDIHDYYSQLVGSNEAGCAGVLCRDVIKLFGFSLRRPYGLPDANTLRGFPLEELLSYGMIKIQEGAINKT